VGVYLLPRGWLQASDSAVFPGATVDVNLSAHADTDWRVELELSHSDGRFVALLDGLSPGGTATAVIPYPFEDLVAGTYTATVCLRDGGGAVIERLAVGRYAVREPVFSA
jgi:hypothetical protein